MKKLLILAAAGTFLASAVAYAQMQHGPGMHGQNMQQGQGMQSFHGRDAGTIA